MAEPAVPLDAFAFLAGGGEMGALMRAHDWASTPLGAPARWPQPLRMAIRLMLNTGHPMYIFWGEGLRCFYNDAYGASIGPERHPGSLGRPAREVWDETWPIIGPQIDHVMSGQGATWNENQLIPITRNGRREDVYWTYSYSPIHDDAAPGGIGGVLVVCTETTAVVNAERRHGDEAERRRRKFEQAPGFICILRGPDHVYEFVNDTHRRLFGSRDWVGKSVREAFPDIAGQGFYELLDNVYATGERYVGHSATVRYRATPDAPEEQRFLDFIYAPIYDDAGRVSGIFCEGFDVTEKHLAQESLRVSEGRYRTLFEAIDSGFCIIEVLYDGAGRPHDYRFIEVNPAFARQTGLRDAVGKTARELLPDLELHWFEIYGRVAATGEGERFENGSDAMDRWFDVYAFRTGEPEARRVAILFTDISERRRAEMALQRLNASLELVASDALAERRVFAEIVESTDAFIQVADLNFCWMAINKASADEFERIFGVRPKVGDCMLDLLAGRPEHQAAVREVWGRALAGEAFTETAEFGDETLTRRSYEMKFSPLRDRDGRLVGAYQFVYDVTERIRDQARLAEAERQLLQAQKIEAIGRLTGGVAHDFNNLLMVISGGLGILERQPDEERRRRILGSMRQAVERGASLSRQLLAFSRRQSLKPEPVDLVRQVEGMRELLDRSLSGDVHVETQFPADLWPVRVDPAELELVLLNLCVNARDAMPEGGAITIAARNLADRRDGGLDGDYVRLTVTDSGVGMTAEVMRRAFEPFFTTKDIGKGSGLGLAQVHGFVAQSAGRVEVDSTVGEGTTVSLWLPRSLDAAAPAAERPIPGLPHTAPVARIEGEVLLVEDDDEVAALVSEMLRELGYGVTRAGTADSALGALANGRQIDLVFSDVMLPGQMNGLELAREIRHRRPGLPIVLTSGYSEAAKHRAEVEGIELLPKPYQIDSLASILREAAASHGGTA